MEPTNEDLEHQQNIDSQMAEGKDGGDVFGTLTKEKIIETLGGDVKKMNEYDLSLQRIIEYAKRLGFTEPDDIALQAKELSQRIGLKNQGDPVKALGRWLYLSQELGKITKEMNTIAKPEEKPQEETEQKEQK